MFRKLLRRRPALAETGLLSAAEPLVPAAPRSGAADPSQKPPATITHTTAPKRPPGPVDWELVAALAPEIRVLVGINCDQERQEVIEALVARPAEVLLVPWLDSAGGPTASTARCRGGAACSGSLLT